MIFGSPVIAIGPVRLLPPEKQKSILVGRSHATPSPMTIL